MHPVNPLYAALRSVDPTALQGQLKRLRNQVLNRGDPAAAALLEACLAALKGGEETEALASRILHQSGCRVQVGARSGADYSLWLR